ncbi:Protein kinase-like domain [Pseudocohnilembus persalinus]|uniref:Protein kinase-like domain n=1 Tax=Pseudocohnilembus persalinus TaxID=266149 RepID=A0A0V0R8F4_PSEPJ|nr:Protein kinase-like domain [Pseudocohnilembus persalinus]|eukprot:KRX10761.1 Protein kinase-like domain [Pseudocohnilembus persalinus]
MAFIIKNKSKQTISSQISECNQTSGSSSNVLYHNAEVHQQSQISGTQIQQNENLNNTTDQQSEITMNHGEYQNTKTDLSTFVQDLSFLGGGGQGIVIKGNYNGEIVAIKQIYSQKNDLKPQNILVKHDGGGQLIIKISDFGLSKQITDQNSQHSNDVGTKTYIGIEKLRHIQFGADIFQSIDRNLTLFSRKNEQQKNIKRRNTKVLRIQL